MHLVRVAEALGVAAGIIGEVGHVLHESGGGALKGLVGFVATADDDFVRLLEVPLHAAFRAVDAEVETAFPTGGDLGHGAVGVHAVGMLVPGLAKLQQHTGEVLGVDFEAHHLLGIDFRKGLHLALRTFPGFVEGFHRGVNAFGPRAEDEGHGVDPMRADVAHGAQFPALAGLNPPVVIRLLQKPVLEEVPLHMNDAAEVVALDHGFHLQHGGEEAAHVVHRKDTVALLRSRHHTRGLLRVHTQRLFANDVLAGFQRRDALLDVHLVRRSDVDDVDVRAREHGFVIVVAIHLRDAPHVSHGERA